MPNWCATNIFFYGNEELIKDFHRKLTKWLSADKSIYKNSFGVGWLGNVLAYTFGNDFVKENISNDNLRFRGLVEYMDEEISHCKLEVGSKDVCFFRVDTESAWCPHMKMWYLIIEKLYGKNADISIAYVSDEPGIGVYCICDPDHIIYDTEKVYRVDAWDINCKFGLEECFCEYGEDELIKAIKDFFDISCTKDMLDDADKLNEMIQDVIKESGQSENDCGFYVKKYEIVDKEDY